VQFDFPSFLSFSNLGSAEDDLLITQFSEFLPGSVYSVANIADQFKSSSTVKFVPQTLGNDYTWPNLAEIIPSDVYSSEEKSKLCGGSKSCNLMIVPDGFLTPGHKTGGIFLLASTLTSTPATKIAIAPIETNWFYHKANFLDLDLDGKMDIIAARCNVNAVGVAKGELIWLKHPSDLSGVTEPWQKTTLVSGPDIITLVIKGKDNVVYVVGAEFFAKKLSITAIQPGSTPKIISYTVIDSSLGAADDIHLADVDGDGQSELIVSTHDGNAGGSVFAYELPSNLIPESTSSSNTSSHTSDWKRTTLATGFTVTKAGANQASPGFIYPLENPQVSSSVVQNRRPLWLIAGDGSQGVHMMTPIEDATNPYAYSVSKILEIGGTVGTLAVKDVNNDGLIDMVVPDYDNGYIYFYTLKWTTVIHWQLQPL